MPYTTKNPGPGQKKPGNGRISGNVNTMSGITDALDRLQNRSGQERREELDSEEVVRGGRLFAADGYRYFHPENFPESVVVTPALKKDAERILRTEELEPPTFRMSYPRTDYRSENVVDKIGTAVLRPKNRTWYASISFDRNKLVNADCTNWRCGYTGVIAPGQQKKLKICAHEMALLMVMQDYLKTNNPGDSTSFDGRAFLEEGLRNLPRVDSEEDMTVCTLTPSLVLEDGKAGVSFKYGRTDGPKQKSFKIKDLEDFTEKVGNQESMQFGTTWNPVLGEQKLDEAGREWYLLIRDLLREEQERYEQVTARKRGSWYQAPGENRMQVKDVLPLYGQWLDRAFGILQKQNQVIECIRKEYGRIAEKQTTRISSEAFRPKLKISPMRGEQDEFEGVRVSGQAPEILQGRDRAFSISDGVLMPFDPETARLLRPLLRNGGGQIDASIGRSSLPDFYHKMLPELQKTMEIEETGKGVIRDYLPPEGKVVFYLDALYGSVMGRIDVWYGSECHSVSELIETGRVPEAYRDLEMENHAMRTLLSYLPKYDRQRKIFFSSDEEEIYQFLLNGIDRLMEEGEVRSTERFRRLGVRKTLGLNMGVSLESGLLDLTVTSSEVSEEELLQILFSYHMKKKYYRLKNGNFISLENQDKEDVIVKLGQMMDALHMTPKQFVQGKMKIPAYRSLYLDRMLEEMQGVYTDRDRRFRSLVREVRTGEEADYDVPDSLKGVLRRYQTAGYRWLRMLDHCGFGGILADDMGLGKTVQVIAVFLALKGEGTFLVVSPASLVYNWGEELRRFAPQLKVRLITGTQKERRLKLKEVEEAVQAQDRGFDVIVTSYDLLKRDIDAYESMSFRIAVIDEAQYIKNSGTAAAKAVKLIHANTRYALTGTPIENRLSELWSIFGFLMPGFLYPYETFRGMFETPIVKNQDEEAAGLLRRMVTPFILRRLKKDVLKDLPDKIEEVRYAGMEKDQQKLYDAQVVLMKKTLESQNEEEFNRNRIQILAELTRIRQICCDPSLCFESYSGSSAKREACLDLIRNAIDGGHKILLFSQFTSMLSILEADLSKEGIPYYKIIGDTPKEQRLALVNSFNKDDTPLFLISLKAGGTGLNLTGADIVIHYDPWWNLAAQNQATDRAHRIGQTKVVNVYRMILKNTIEEKILELQEAKQKLSDDILSAEGIASSKIDRDELLALLG